MILSRADLAGVRRVVIKVGSSLLADADKGVRQDMVEYLAVQTQLLRQRSIDVCLVSSGAVALGRVHLGWVGKQLSVHEKQAAAAVGQPMLMRAYERAFAARGMKAAQLLLTKDDLRHRRRYLNASNTSQTLFDAGIVPIVNENDTVVVEEIKFGDNDNLSALVSLLIDADLLLMLTDVDGLYDADPNEQPMAARRSLVASITPEIMAMAGDSAGHFGTGGMGSKLHAARIASRGAVATAIINGHDTKALPELLAGNDVGTLFACSADRRSRRKHWIADVLRPQGRIWIDAGARQAVVKRGASLLPVGMLRVEGAFDKGECVELIASDGVIARGLSNYHAEELRKLVGAGSGEIERILGYNDYAAVIHRDHLVLTGDEAVSMEEE
ncbi:MAG: glutamate 5-kinase [Mariprofundaceae bacterium]